MTLPRMVAITTAVRLLPEWDAARIVSHLTNSGSEFHREVADRVGSETPIAVIKDGSGMVVAWAASHYWRGQQTLEGFTDPSCRRSGLARAAAAMLVADGTISTQDRIAVFSPTYIAIASSVGCRDVHLYGLRDGDWFENS